MVRSASTAVAALATLFAVTSSSPAWAEDRDRVNGSIRVQAGDKIEDASTVNGSINVDDNATLEDASTVNGSINVGDGASAKSLATVNGAVRVGKGTRVSGDVGTVNGSVRLDEEAEVSGHVGNVNGRIELNRARVTGGLKTVSGDIWVGRDSRVGRGILVEKPSGWNWGKRDVPKVVIGPGAVVDGTLEFEHEVKLYVSDTARIGKVVGATPTRFSGDEPPEG